jgi:adenine-specific DNA methylase
MALVLPGELLHVGYAAAVRDFLLRSFSELTLISFEEKIFPGALEEVVLVLGIKEQGDGRLRVLRLNSLRDLQRPPEQLLAERRTTAVQPGQRWLTALLEEESVATALGIIQRAQFVRLGELGRVDIGAVTGANDFFVLSRAEAQLHGLPEAVLLPAVSKAVHIPGARFTRRDWELMGTKGDPVFLLTVEQASVTEAVARYLATGEAQGLAKRYKCRTRTPWYKVPYVRRPDLFLTYMSHISPRLVVNELRATHTNTVHGIFLTDPLLAEPLAAAFLNSATLLSAEIEGRSYGGGVLKLEPGEAVRVFVPRLTPKMVEALRTSLPKVDLLVREGKVEEASLVVDRIVLRNFRREEREAVRSLLSSLRARRFTRGKTS